MKMYYYHVSFIKTHGLWSSYKAKRETLATFDNLKADSRNGPTVWPLRPYPTTRTSLFSSMKYEQSSLLEQLHGRKPGCLTLTSTGRGYAKWVFLELLFMPLLVLSVVQNVLAGLRLWHLPFLRALLTWAKDQSSTGSLANFLVDVITTQKRMETKMNRKEGLVSQHDLSRCAKPVINSSLLSWKPALYYGLHGDGPDPASTSCLQWTPR